MKESEEAGKEDGWISITIGSETCEGVLEIKGTGNSQFKWSQGGRQLLDWIRRGGELRKKKYKEGRGGFKKE